MRRLMVSSMLALASTSLSTVCVAQDFSLLVGTSEVQFVPMRSAGVTFGCTLVFKTIALDHIYERGSLLLAVGNIAYVINREGNNLSFALKLGLQYPLKDPAMVPPNYAYIDSPSGTTAKSKFVDGGSDSPGYKIFIYQVDDTSASVIGDLLKGAPVKIGFNRRDGGMDVILPIDLSVESSTPKAEGGFLRKRSTAAQDEFRACFNEVTGRLTRR